MGTVVDLLVLLILVGLIAAGGYAVFVLRVGLGQGGGTATLDSLKTELDAHYQAEMERMRGETRGAVAEIEAELGRLREGLRSSAHEHDTQLVRLRDRYAEVDGQTAQALERALGELRMHQEAELGRLREAVGAAMAAIAARQPAPSDGAGGRRAEAIAELTRKLARLETAFGSATNPVLLPGENFALPETLPAETLKWEHWKEVGDAAFAFAETFSQERVYLDDATCREVSAFIRGLREEMTGTISPNLLAKPGLPAEESRAALRAGLEHLGHEIPAARERLERAYRESTER